MATNLNRAILLGLVGKTIKDIKYNNNGNLSLIFKDGDKVSLVLHTSRGIDYLSIKDPRTVKLEKITKKSEKMLEVVETKPKKKVFKSLKKTDPNKAENT